MIPKKDYIKYKQILSDNIKKLSDLISSKLKCTTIVNIDNTIGIEILHCKNLDTVINESCKEICGKDFDYMRIITVYRMEDYVLISV